MSLSLLLGTNDFPDRADRPHLDAADGCRRYACRELDRFVQVARLDHVEAREKLLGLGEGTIGHRNLAVAHPHRGRGRHRLQRLGGDAVAAATDFIVKGHAVAVGHVRQRLLLAVYQAEIFHGYSPTPSLRNFSIAGLFGKSSSSKYCRTSISPTPPSIDGLGK